MLALFLVTYLVLMNAMTVKSFEMKKLEGRAVELRRQAARLEAELARRESIANVAERVSALGMVPVERVDYVTIGGAVVAYR